MLFVNDIPTKRIDASIPTDKPLHLLVYLSSRVTRITSRTVSLSCKAETALLAVPHAGFKHEQKEMQFYLW